MPGTGWYLRQKVPFLGYCSRFRKLFQVVAAMLPELNHVDTLLGQGAAKRKNVITGGMMEALGQFSTVITEKSKLHISSNKIY